ncbi:MAG: nucleotidyltransferase domain-containing protein [Bacillota bacterium]|nr:nucleotidyltransferase domain-containing protein [Bacillota bacterium]
MNIDFVGKVAEEFGIAFMYLFGSQAENGYDYMRGSTVELNDPLADLDIGIIFKAGILETDIVSLYANLYNELDVLFDPFQVDLVLLEENHSVFQANAISGICIYSYDDCLRGQHEENILRRAADFKPFLDKYLQEYLEEVIS